MRIALVHDRLVADGGAEKVLSAFIQEFRPDVFTLFDILDGPTRTKLLHGLRPKTSYLQHVPFLKHIHRQLLPFYPHAIESLDVRGYDVIISSSYAVAKGIRTRKDQAHICYIHTPMRYAWVQEEMYLKDHGVGRGPVSWLIRAILERIRKWDLRTNAGVDRFVANSRNVANRVQRYYGLEADVLLPPVDIDEFSLFTGERTHFISAARAVPYKRVSNIIAAFRDIPGETLIVCGDGPELASWRKDLPPNVLVIGHVDDAQLVELMQRAKALIAVADEDLGITPLEAMACGTPVIALHSGGYLETVIEGRNGSFIPTNEPAHIRAAVVAHASKEQPDPSLVRSTVEAYSTRDFLSRFRELMDRTVNDVAPK